MFSWENANDVVICHRILRVKQEVDEPTCEAWASLIVAYNNHYMDRHRNPSILNASFLEKALKEYRKTYEVFFSPGKKAEILRNVTPEHFKITKSAFSPNLEMAEEKFHQEEYETAIFHLETALSAIHDLLENLTNLITYFPPPIKQGLRKTAFFGLLTAIFTELPADSVGFSANRTEISIKNYKILVQNAKNSSKTSV